MTFAEDFEQFGLALYRLDVAAQDIVYRKDGQPSMSVKVKDGLRVKQTKPVKSLHIFFFGEGKVLRVKRSNFERKKHVETMLEVLKEERYAELQEIVLKMKGIRKGKNIHWEVTDDKYDFESVKEYLKQVQEEKEASTQPAVEDKPFVADDLQLVSGWEI